MEMDTHYFLRRVLLFNPSTTIKAPRLSIATVFEAPVFGWEATASNADLMLAIFISHDHDHNHDHNHDKRTMSALEYPESFRYDMKC